MDTKIDTKSSLRIWPLDPFRLVSILVSTLHLYRFCHTIPRSV